MVDLSTTYLGLQLKNPVVASSSPLSKKVDSVKRLEDAGVAALVMHSLFEEQLQHESMELDYYLHRGSDSFAEALSYFPALDSFTMDPDGYLEHVRRLKEAVDIPVIGSLNGISSGGWLDYAKGIEQAGADALELNMYYIATDVDLSGAELERTYVELVQSLAGKLDLPIAVKLSPFFTSVPNIAWLLSEAGADGLVMFNRFYQPDLDLDKLEVVPDLVLSNSDELRLPLRWIAILYGRVNADLAATTGIHTAMDVMKVVAGGASVAMMTSALLQNGVECPKEILSDIHDWMEEHEYESIAQMKGSMSQKAVAEPAAFERANYMKALGAFEHAHP
jgi:dihydroorotate dehydrogenase (fumarate)